MLRFIVERSFFFGVIGPGQSKYKLEHQFNSKNRIHLLQTQVDDGIIREQFCRTSKVGAFCTIPILRHVVFIIQVASTFNFLAHGALNFNVDWLPNTIPTQLQKGGRGMDFWSKNYSNLQLMYKMFPFESDTTSRKVHQKTGDQAFLTLLLRV